ncbi:MAG: AI-2E family transporter [Mesorhizobium amorphae]|nr:MAG: AI-2E family transporter [Mesorhizobium amorphae]
MPAAAEKPKPIPAALAASTPAAIPPAETPTIGAMLALQVGVVVIAALYLARDVLVPITVAVLLSFVVSPLVGILRKTRIGRIPSVLLAVFAASLVVLALLTVIGAQLAQLAGRIPEYIGTFQNKIEAIRTYAVENFSSTLDRMGMGSLFSEALPQAGEAAAAGETASGVSDLSTLLAYASPVISPIATASIIFVVSIFILLQKEDLRDRLIRLFGSSDLHKTTVAMDDAAKRLSRYFLTQLTVNFGFGAVVGTGLFLIGVPNPILWGLLSGVMRFIPYVGPILSAGLPIMLAAAVDPGWSMVLWAAALFVVAELITNQIVEPIAYGHSTGLSPFAVIVAAIFWGWLWGPVGLILSMPLTLCLVVLGRHVERLEFLDVLFGDRPALTPVESFYQRILAGDADEAQDHAELLITERPLSSYYDAVALKGLQMAAADAERGAIKPDQLERIRETVTTLINELDVHEDREPEGADGDKKAAPVEPTQDQKGLPSAPPPPSVDRNTLAPEWLGERAVLCLAGRGALDEAASTMLAQLLEKHGLHARVAPYQAASREGIETLDVEGVAMVCISYLDISGSPSHLRYLLRRLQKRLPGAPILVGLWPEEDDTLKNPAMQARIGADFYTSTLRAAVEACVGAAQESSGQKALPAPENAKAA